MSATIARRAPGLRACAIAIASLVLAMLCAVAGATGQPAQTVKVSVTDGKVSLEAVDAPLGQVLVKVGEALHARVIVENVLAGDLASARVTRSFTALAPVDAFRRLLFGRNYAVMEGPKGVDEIRVFVDGTTGYQDLTTARATGRPTTGSPAERPGNEAAELARLRQAALDAPDSSARREALEDLASIGDTPVLRDTLIQALARERDSMVLETLLGVASQHRDALPPEALRGFVASNRDATARSLAVEQLAARSGSDPATRTLLRTLVANDASPEVREAAQIALESLEPPAAPPPAPAARPPR